MLPSVLMPICELCDRLTIAQLKYERLTSDEIDKEGLLRQISYYQGGISPPPAGLTELVQQLKTINGSIWDAEYLIRKGLDESLGLEEIGRRALQIRNLNRERISIKNAITALVQQPEFVDCKMNHVSS